MDSSIPTFSPERCADLHNQLFAKAIENNPTPEFADIPSLDSLPLYRFLGLLNTTPLVGNQFAALLTPLMFQPDPTIFWSERIGHEPHFILLYGQHNSDSPMDGGVYLDIQSYRVVWHGGHTVHFPPTDQWLPLEAILQKSLDAWTTGKFYWNTERATIVTRRWTRHDLEQSILAWNRLLSSIEFHMPPEADATRCRLAPLSPQSLAPFHIKRPDFSFVAPGIRALDSRRREHCLGDIGEEDWPTLILPGVGPVPHDFTVSRQSGLYLMPDNDNSDGVRLVAASGLCNACEFGSPCRWGPAEEPKLAEVFNHWATLVEDGTRKVDSNRVCDLHAWFTSNIDQGQFGSG
ncbi:hypothetical protein F4801DRAFT_594695 [Xylaria longipes]|nr:hypothetical protein F4801DRAFT_594695 [Xylaria longipes]